MESNGELIHCSSNFIPKKIIVSALLGVDLVCRVYQVLLVQKWNTSLFLVAQAMAFKRTPKNKR
jgi:hypothetical protein